MLKPKKIKKGGVPSVFGRMRRALGRGRRAIGRGIRCLRCRLRLTGPRLGRKKNQASGNAAARRGAAKAMAPRTAMPASRHDKENN